MRGQAADMERIGELAAAHGLAVVEDAAQAHGARHRDRRAGALGDAAAFSFYPAKNLGCFGDGGAVTTDDEAIADRVRVLRNYGMRNRYEIEAAGVNSRLAELQAAVLRVKLPRLDAWNESRRHRAGRYAEALAGCAAAELPEVPAWAEPVWHLFMVNLPDRDACAAALRAGGIEALVHYPVLPHLSPPYLDAELPEGGLPVAERLAETTLSLPMHPHLDPADLDRVAAAVQASAASKSS
jgi:dTDP-3-amino-3,4,6-trideoxy-alpha-D-glucose transaminase